MTAREAEAQAGELRGERCVCGCLRSLHRLRGELGAMNHAGACRGCRCSGFVAPRGPHTDPEPRRMTDARFRDVWSRDGWTANEGMEVEADHRRARRAEEDLREALAAKDAEIARLRADNAALVKALRQHGKTTRCPRCFGIGSRTCSECDGGEVAPYVVEVAAILKEPHPGTCLLEDLKKKEEAISSARAQIVDLCRALQDCSAAIRDQTYSSVPAIVGAALRRVERLPDLLEMARLTSPPASSHLPR